MDYEFSIFISYGHIDNQPLFEGEQGWISLMHASLEKRLTQLMGYVPKIFRAPRLGGNDMLSETLQTRVRNSALLLSVITPKYIQSKWCKFEVDEFIEAAEQDIGLVVGHRSRIFKVVKTPVPLEKHPEPMIPLLGYDFYEVDQATGRPREFGEPFDRETKLKFWAKINDLAHDIYDSLAVIEEMKAQPPKPPDTVPSSAPETSSESPPQSSKAIFLAETSYDLRQERDTIKRLLSDEGFQVFPDRPFIMVKEEAESAIQEDLDRSDFSVHLIGNSYGIIPENSSHSIVELQNLLAAEYSQKKGLKRIIWIPEHLSPTNAQQQTLLQNLQSNAQYQVGAEVLVGSLEELKSALQKQLQEPATVNAPASPPGDSSPIVYLVCDEEDLPDVQPLEDHLFDHGFEVILPVFEGDESDIRQEHQENLIECDAVLIFYGHTNQIWVRKKLREIRKIQGYGREKPIQTTGIYLAGPLTPEKERFRMRDVLVVPNTPTASVDPSHLTPFIQQMQTSS